MKKKKRNLAHRDKVGWVSGAVRSEVLDDFPVGFLRRFGSSRSGVRAGTSLLHVRLHTKTSSAARQPQLRRRVHRGAFHLKHRPIWFKVQTLRGFNPQSTPILTLKAKICSSSVYPNYTYNFLQIIFQLPDGQFEYLYTYSRVKTVHEA